MSPTPSITASDDSLEEFDELDELMMFDPTEPPTRRPAPVRNPRPPPHGRYPGIPRNGLRHYYTVRFDAGPDANASDTNHVRDVAFGGGVGWVVDNFRPHNGFKHWPMQEDFPHDVTFPDGAGGTATIPARELDLWHVARVQSGNSGGGGGGVRRADGRAARARGVPRGVDRAGGRPALARGQPGGDAGDAGGRGRAAGVPARAKRHTVARAVLAETAEGCMAVVFMGRDKAVYYYDAEKGLAEAPANMEFAPSRIDQLEQLGEIYRLQRELLSDMAGITDLQEVRAMIKGGE